MTGVCAFRHVPFEHLGSIAPALESRGLAVRYVDMFEGARAPERIGEAAGLIFMGGPMSANDNLPCLRAELALIEQAAKAGQPVLGVCLGAQLIAKALGARVYRNRAKEIGWFPVWWTPAAAGDPLFAGLSAPETVFHWHGETFDLPPGAEWLARSEACAHQAFRVGANVYGLQFHLEVTPEMIADWVTQDQNSHDVRELDAPIDPHANAPRLRELATLVFGRWADLVASRTPRSK
jgi:GMP synthase-like glutamine amidotransferase